MKNVLFIFTALIALPMIGFGQWTNDGFVTSTSFTNPQVRSGNTGVGFTDATDYNSAAGASGAKFLVKGGILSHYVSGSVDNFSGKWCGLGIGNPGGPAGSPKPYGLAIADTGSVAFYNALRENFNGVIRKNTVAGFGAESIRNTESGVYEGLR